MDNELKLSSEFTFYFKNVVPIFPFMIFLSGAFNDEIVLLIIGILFTGLSSLLSFYLAEVYINETRLLIKRAKKFTEIAFSDVEKVHDYGFGSLDLTLVSYKVNNKDKRLIILSMPKLISHDKEEVDSIILTYIQRFKENIKKSPHLSPTRPHL